MLDIQHLLVYFFTSRVRQNRKSSLTLVVIRCFVKKQVFICFQIEDTVTPMKYRDAIGFPWAKARFLPDTTDIFTCNSLCT